MIKNPFLNALLAFLYIIVIIFVIQSITGFDDEKEAGLLIPMAMLSLFVLSVATMGLLFVYTPLKLFLENQKEQALGFFLKTLGTFALCVLVLIIVLKLFI